MNFPFNNSFHFKENFENRNLHCILLDWLIFQRNNNNYKQIWSSTLLHFFIPPKLFHQNAMQTFKMLPFICVKYEEYS